MNDSFLYSGGDTIVALATPAGSGGLGVIRVSGPEAITLAQQLFSGRDLSQSKGQTIHFGKIIDPANGQIIDEVLLTLFRTPSSFTGEDVVEISAHGSPYVLSRIIDLCCRKGARLAAPGEYTMRAYLNGKMDLAQAEAVGDLIQAETRGAHSLAMKQMRGGFSDELNALREKLIEFAALLELELDFSEEDIEFADRQKFLIVVKELKEKISSLVDSFRLGNAMKNGISVAIIGKPNAGKSTLLNALLNEDRAIVSEIPGTTRDTIEEALNINGTLFRFIDTAGIRAHSTDVIENLGIERSKLNADKADIILHLIDLTNIAEDQEDDWLDPYHAKIVEVYNKWELWEKENRQNREPGELSDSALLINAKSGEGVDRVKDAIYTHAFGEDKMQYSVIVSNARHHDALRLAYECLTTVEAGFQIGLPTELIAIDMRSALQYLGEITGTVDVDRDILGAIFGKFCIGK